MKKLTKEEIEKFASRKGVKRIAVENFLMTNTNNQNSSVALANLNLDTHLYRWNAETRRAIYDGIMLAAEEEG